MEKPYGFIYETTNNINGMKYIGKCVYHRQNDWNKYLGSGLYLKRAINKYGRENFTRVILQEAYSAEELQDLEEMYIRRFDVVNSPAYYNIKLTSMGGDCFSTNPRKEDIRNMRVQQMSGESNHQYGRPKSDKMIASVKKANSRAVEIDGVTYKSRTEASRTLGISLSTISYRITHETFTTYRCLATDEVS